jgi:Polyketide cyclase / dehydrase and lipid transport
MDHGEKRSTWNATNDKRNSMLEIILIALAVIVLVLVVIIALQPSDFRVARSTTVSAPPPAVFAQVNDFHKWEAWNPWGKIDPAMKQAYDGAPAGTAAIYKWAGNNEVGEGCMTIIESRPSELIRIKLEFVKPFAATNTAEFTFKPEGNQTAVTWSMFGEKNFMAKAVHLFMNMDKMIGGQFEKGLASMKSIVEGARA